MWNRSYRWQRQLRLATGVVLLVALAIGSAVLYTTGPANRARAGATDLVREIVFSREQVVEVEVPANLAARVGTLVYMDRDDGIAQVVGRVVVVDEIDVEHARLSIRLMGPAAEHRGGVFKGTPATLDLRSAVRLLISPSTPEEEAMIARDTIWPSVREGIVPGMIDRLIRETTKELASLDLSEPRLSPTVERLREAVKPFEDKLVNQLARRAWDTVGIQGLAAGVVRDTVDDVQSKSVKAADWWLNLFGAKSKATATDRPFLSPETSQALQTALEEETFEFWLEHRTAILDALAKVVDERRQDLESVFGDRWVGLLYERAVLPAWQAGQEKVLASVQTYANDFAARRLLTKEGGPRLLFAHALRSSLKISDAPLLIFAPDDSDRTIYEPLIR